MRATTLLHAEGLAGHPGGDDVGVVAAAAGREGLRVGDPGLDQGVAVEADPHDGAAAEVGGELAERLGVHVDDSDRMALPVHGLRERGPDSAAAEDHDVHDRNATRGPWGVRTVRSIHPRGNLLRRRRSACCSDVPCTRTSSARPCSPSASPCRSSPPTPCRPTGTPPRRSCSSCPSAGTRSTSTRPGWRLRSSWCSSSWSLSYRQNVHAYPSGGGDYEVVSHEPRAALGRLRRQRADGRLRAHRGRVDLLGRGQRRPRRSRGWASTAWRWPSA